MSDFYYTKDIRVDAFRDSPLIEGEDQDRLNSLKLFNVAARTWPYIRPEIKHLSILAVLFILLILAGFTMIGITTGTFYNNLLEGEPLSDRVASILNLESSEYRDVEKLSSEARRDVRVGLFKFDVVLAQLLELASL